MGRQAEAQTLRHVMGELLSESVLHIFLAEHVDPGPDGEEAAG